MACRCVCRRRGRMDAARERLARIVSHDVSGFGTEAIRQTAIKSFAENLNESVVAPLFWYAVLGLPGAAVYRVANTLDAMWGHHGPWEWAGKCRLAPTMSCHG